MFNSNTEKYLFQDVYSGHEYTVQNLLFALRVEPFNQDIIDVLKAVGVKRKTEDPSVPSTIGKNVYNNMCIFT